MSGDTKGCDFCMACLFYGLQVVAKL